jgi:hypothetical protein
MRVPTGRPKRTLVTQVTLVKPPADDVVTLQ